MEKTDFNIKDLNIKIWNNDVFITSYNNFDFSKINGAINLQCNYECDTDIYKDIMDLCNEISFKILKLRNLLK